MKPTQSLASPSRRRLLQTAGAAAMIGIPGISFAAPAVTLRSSISQAPNQYSALYLWHQYFDEELKKTVGDRVKVDLFPNGQLGKESDIVQQVRIGAVDMMASGSSIWATALPELSLLDMGFLFDDWDHVDHAIDAGVGEQFNRLLQARTGSSVIGWGNQYNARSVYTKKDKVVTKLAELKDVKLRVLPTPIFVETFKLLGAIPTPIPVNELYTAVQTGVVDGFEHDAGTILASKFNEVVSNCWLTNHLYSPSVTVIGKRGLGKVPKDLQPAFLKAADAATQRERAEAVKRGLGTVAELEKLGITYHPMDPTERKNVVRMMSEKLWPGVVKSYPATQPMMDIINKTRA